MQQTEDEELWYDRAFGPLRNIMRIKFHFNPLPGKIEPKFKFVVKLTYNMYPEFVEEFGSDQYPAESLIELEEDYDENDNIEFLNQVDVPYGDFKTEILFKQKSAEEGEEGFELKPLPSESGL